MDEAEFVPFVARRYAAPVESSVEEVTPQDDGSQPSDTPDERDRHDPVGLCDPGADVGASASEIVAPERPSREPLVPPIEGHEAPVPAAPPACDHGVEIRNEAVRLAAIACGRALRHAVVLHPGIIASFVDDALRSAGFPDGARVRVHPESVGRLELPAQVIGDDRLELGDVHIDVPGAGVGADLATRAALLVAAAAQA